MFSTPGGPWLVLLLLGPTVLSTQAAADTIPTRVVVGDPPAVLEAQRSGWDLENGTLKVWVWVSDPNGIQDVAAVELTVDGEPIATARSPTWAREGIARFSLEIDRSDLGQGLVQIEIEEADGRRGVAPLDLPEPVGTQALGAGGSAPSPVPGPGLSGFVTVVGVALAAAGGLPRRAGSGVQGFHIRRG